VALAKLGNLLVHLAEDGLVQPTPFLTTSHTLNLQTGRTRVEARSSA
jgi:hypothetical protein